jgi:hypothetical protein
MLLAIGNQGFVGERENGTRGEGTQRKKTEIEIGAGVC